MRSFLVLVAVLFLASGYSASGEPATVDTPEDVESLFVDSATMPWQPVEGVLRGPQIRALLPSESTWLPTPTPVLGRL